VFKAKNTIKSQLVKFKPKNEWRQKNVIHSIPCECRKCYIGETGRTLEVRLGEHKKSIQKRDPDISKLCEHHYTTGHRILWNEAEITMES
jgi:hypothetical protein